MAGIPLHSPSISSVDQRNFLTSGSGCLAASTVLETHYKEDLSVLDPVGPDV